MPDVIPLGFALWDFYGAKRIHRGLELFGAVDNFTDSRDPNIGKLANGRSKGRAAMACFGGGTQDAVVEWSPGDERLAAGTEVGAVVVFAQP
jgi:hypothetical protein